MSAYTDLLKEVADYAKTCYKADPATVRIQGVTKQESYRDPYDSCSRCCSCPPAYYYTLEFSFTYANPRRKVKEGKGSYELDDDTLLDYLTLFITDGIVNGK